MKRLSLVLSLALAACGGVEVNPQANQHPSSNDPGYDATKPCGGANKCPAGQFCFNGLCAMGCNSNGDCAADQYCDTTWKECVNKVVATCPDTPCPDTQMCVKNLCTSKEPPATKCDPQQAGYNDGCEKDAICFQDQGKDPVCYSFPACGENGACPPGMIGAVCNDGYLPSKGHICLPGSCKTATNCPNAGFKCVRSNPNAPLGMCSNGGPGMACPTAADCVTGNCSSAGPGWPGVCF